MSAGPDAPQISIRRLAALLTARLRLPVEEVPDAIPQVRLSDIAKPNGFGLRLAIGWRSVEAIFQPDTYAGHLIQMMGRIPPEAKESCSKLIDAFSALGARSEMRINNAPVDLKRLPEAPWNNLELSVRHLTTATEDEAQLLLEAVEVSSACLSILMSLLPISENDSRQPSAIFEGGLPEGAKKLVQVNRYERSAVNRAACIARFGAVCAACNFKFEDKYGQIGAGYIEVHHIVPVSKMGAGYIVDPFVDLVPLCSNCHSIVHAIDPPMDIAKLKALISGRVKSN